MSVKRMRPICRTIVTLAICFGGNGVGAKPATPKYDAKTIGIAESQDSVPRVSGFLDPNGAYYNRQGKRVTPPAEAGASLRGQTIATTPGVNQSASGASGVLSPNGAYQGMRSSAANVVQQGVLDLNPNVDVYKCLRGSEVVQCKTTKTISNDGKGGWSKQNVAAYYAAQQLYVDGQCFPDKNKEAALFLLKKGDQYYYGYKSEYLLDRDAHSSAPANIEKYRKELEDQGYSIVGIVHNHPLSAPGMKTVFSEADMANAQMKTDGHPAIDCYMVSCDESSMSANGEMKLFRYVGAEDKAYVVKADGSQDPADYIKGGTSAAGQVTSTLNEATQGKNEGASDQKAGTMKDVDSQIAIDTSTLEKLLKKKIAFLESLLARGEPATNAQLESDNAVSQAYRAELEKIMKEIGGLKISDEEKTKLFKEIEQKLQPDSKRLIQLMQQAVDEKLIAGVTFQSVNGITGTESESASDNGGCKCKNPSPQYTKVSDSIPAAVKCTRCGKTVGVLHHGKIISTSRP